MSAPQRRRNAPSRPAPRMRKADRKRQLLECAKQLFVTYGFNNTTTKRIADEAGISEPVLYRHFATKKALFLEVLHEIRLRQRIWAESLGEEIGASDLRQANATLARVLEALTTS